MTPYSCASVSRPKALLTTKPAITRVFDIGTTNRCRSQDSHRSHRVHADGPDSGLLVRLHGPVDAAGGMFAAPTFEVVEGLGVVVKVFLGPSGAQVPLVGPFDAIPAVAAGGGSFGHSGESQPSIRRIISASGQFIETSCFPAAPTFLLVACSEEVSGRLGSSLMESPHHCAKTSDWRVPSRRGPPARLLLPGGLGAFWIVGSYRTPAGDRSGDTVWPVSRPRSSNIEGAGHALRMQDPARLKGPLENANGTTSDRWIPSGGISISTGGRGV